MRSLVRGRKVPYPSPEKIPVADGNFALCDASIVNMSGAHERVRFVPPPAACANCIGKLVKFFEGAEYIIAG
jgi:hypothetical protein